MKTIAQVFIFLYPDRFEVITLGIVVIDGKDHSKTGGYVGAIADLPAFEVAAKNAGFNRQPGGDGLHIFSRYTDDGALPAGIATDETRR